MNAITENLDVLVEPRQIVVATDLRDSRYLLPIAIAQAKVTNSHLTLVHTFVNPAISSISTHGLVPPGCGMDPEEFAELILADLAKRAHVEGVMCDSVLRQGCSVVEALRDEIRRTDAQRVIIGTRGVGSATQQVLGPVPRSVLRSLEVPILSVSPRARNVERFGVPLCANISETSIPSTITVGRGKKSHIDEHKQDKYFFRCVGSFGA